MLHVLLLCMEADNVLETLLIILVLIMTIVLVFCLKTIHELKKPKEEKKIMSDEDKEKQEKIKKAFNELMEYDYDVALKRGDS